MCYNLTHEPRQGLHIFSAVMVCATIVSDQFCHVSKTLATH